jgi:hypothetical protein
MEMRRRGRSFSLDQAILWFIPLHCSLVASPIVAGCRLQVGEMRIVALCGSIFVS